MQKRSIIVIGIAALSIIGFCAFLAYNPPQGIGPTYHTTLQTITYDNYWITNNSQLIIVIRNPSNANVTISGAYVDDVQANLTPDNITLMPNTTANYTVNAMANGTTWNDGSQHIVKITATDGAPYVMMIHIISANSGKF